MPQDDEAVALGLGANLECPAQALAAAVAGLARGGVSDLRRASLYRTRPVDCEPGTPDFLNTVVCGIWRGSPLALLALCQRLEIELGRPAQHSSRVARALDLDILLLGQRQLASAALTVPHPRLGQRLFVLVPLAEIAGDWVIPPGGETVRGACARELARPGAAAWGQRVSP